MGAVYRIWNEQNGKSYIGQSSRPYKRIKTHLTPGDTRASNQIQDDMLNYAPEVWNWEIVAEEKHYRLWGVSLNELEIENIRKFDSYNNGYNENRGGGVRFSHPTHSEKNLRLDQQRMREEIRHTIGNYLCQQFNSMSLQEFIQRGQIVDQYGSLEEYERQQREEEARRKAELEQERIRQKERNAERGFWGCCVCVFVLFVLIANVMSNC